MRFCLATQSTAKAARLGIASASGPAASLAVACAALAPSAQSWPGLAMATGHAMEAIAAFSQIWYSKLFFAALG